MQAAPPNDRYQMWGYLRSEPDIAKHRKFADWCSHSQVIQMRNEAESEHTVNYLMDHMHGRGLSQEIIFYVRKYGDPTYLLYSQFEDGKKHLYGMYFDEKTANEKLEFLSKQVRGLNERNNLQITTAIETRDDRAARNELAQPISIPNFVLVISNIPLGGQFINGSFIPPVDAPYIPGLDEPSDSESTDTEDDLPELIEPENNPNGEGSNEDYSNEDYSNEEDLYQFFMNMLRHQRR